MTAKGAASGMVVGVAVVFALFFTGNDPLFGINGGLVGLVPNLAVNLAVSAATASQSDVQQA